MRVTTIPGRPIARGSVSLALRVLGVPPDVGGFECSHAGLEYRVPSSKDMVYVQHPVTDDDPRQTPPDDAEAVVIDLGRVPANARGALARALRAAAQEFELRDEAPF